MKESLVDELIEKKLLEHQSPLTPEQARLAALEIAREVATQESDARARANMKRIKDESADYVWETPGIEAEDPAIARAARDRAFQRVGQAFAEDRAEWERQRGMVLGAVAVAANAAVPGSGSAGAAIAAAVPAIAQALISLSGGGGK